MEDHRSALKVVTWFLLVVAVCAVATRLAIKRSTARKFDIDDVLAVGALVRGQVFLTWISVPLLT
jgi:hypothetical protein